MTFANGTVVTAVPTVTVWLAPAVNVMVAGVVALITVTARPTVLPGPTTPSVTLIVADSASTRVITPLFDPLTVASPLTNLMGVAVPNGTAAPDLSVTVGFVPFALSSAPLKVSALSPVYVGSTCRPVESTALIVSDCVAPATWLAAVPVMMK